MVGMSFHPAGVVPPLEALWKTIAVFTRQVHRYSVTGAVNHANHYGREQKNCRPLSWPDNSSLGLGQLSDGSKIAGYSAKKMKWATISGIKEGELPSIH